MKAIFKKILVTGFAGGVGGLVVLLGQFFIQPEIAKRVTQQQEQWMAKQTAYIKAIKLVNQEFGSWERKYWFGDIPNDYTPFTTPVTPKECNDCYAELCLVSENKAIPNLFGKIFTKGKGSSPVYPADRGKLISLMRRDLYGESAVIPGDSVIWFSR